MSEDRSRGKHLIQLLDAVENISSDQSEGAFKIEWTHDLTPKYGCFEIGGMPVDRVNDEVGNGLSMIVPGFAIGKLWRNMLTKEAGHVHAGRREAVVERGWDDHFDDWLA